MTVEAIDDLAKDVDGFHPLKVGRPSALSGPVPPDRLAPLRRVGYGEAPDVASAITLVPGGVGPMTVACLPRNTVVAARSQLAPAP